MSPFKILQKDWNQFINSDKLTKLSIIASLVLTECLFLFFLTQNSLGLVVTLVSFLFFQVLGYLILFDILYLEIPLKLVNSLILVSGTSNIVLGIIYGFSNKPIHILPNPLQNLIGGVVGGIIILIIVLITKEKGMGGGDIKILALIGLLIGLEKMIIGLYIAIYLALVVSVPLIIYYKRIKNIQIPFVPFLIFGAMIAFVLNLRIGFILFI